MTDPRHLCIALQCVGIDVPCSICDTDEDPPFDPATWPQNEHGRFICTRQRPMPSDHTGKWFHRDVLDDGECPDGCCDDWFCPACGERWREELPQ